MGAGLCHKAVIPILPGKFRSGRGLPSRAQRGSSGATLQEAPVPTLFRFLFVVAVLAGLGFGAMIALAYLVQPEPREITVPVPSNRMPSSS